MARVLRNPHIEGMVILEDEAGQRWWVKLSDGSAAWSRRHRWTHDLTGQVPDPDTLLDQTLQSIGYVPTDTDNIPDNPGNVKGLD